MNSGTDVNSESNGLSEVDPAEDDGTLRIEDVSEGYSRIPDLGPADIPDEFIDKLSDIRSALIEKDVDNLRELAISKGGLLSDSIRRKAWLELIGVSVSSSSECVSKSELEKHRDYQQVVMDVNRTLKRFPPGINDDEREVLQEQLTAVLVTVLSRHSEFHYYQGYHDVGLTLLLVLGQRASVAVLEHLSQTHLKDFLSATMEKTNRLLHYIYPIFSRHSPDLYQFLIKADVGTMFCLPWLITWFGHVLDDYRTVVRLFDYFLASPPLSPLYLCAAVVMHREADILAEECDMAMQHALLSKLNKGLPFDELIEDSVNLYDLYPPKDIEPEVAAVLQDRGFLPRPPVKNMFVTQLVGSLPVRQILLYGVVVFVSYGVYIYWKKENLAVQS